MGVGKNGSEEGTATTSTLDQVRYTADMARNWINHFFREGERFVARGGYHSPINASLTLSLQRALEDVGVENDGDKEEVEIFTLDQNIEKSDADGENEKAESSSPW